MDWRKLSAYIIGVGLVVALYGGAVVLANPDEYAPIGKYASCRYSLEYMAPLLGVQRGTVVLRRDGEEKIGQHMYVKQVAVFSGVPGAEPETTFYRKAKDGVYAIDGKHKDKAEYREIALPVEVGAAWKYATAERSCDCRVGAMETAELLNTRYERTLRVGCTCKKGFEDQSEVTHLAPGLGMVKQTFKGSRGVVGELALQECK